MKILPYLGCPMLPLRDEQVDERALIVSLKRRPSSKRGGEHLARLHSDLPFRTHGCPSVEEIQAPLAIAQQEAARVEPHPALLVVDHLVEPMQHHVYIVVLCNGKLEHHVRKHRVRVHPPYPLHL